MVKLKPLTFLFTIISLCTNSSALACSMYKVTVNNKTIVGTNYDAYSLTPRIWFENATTARQYGVVFTGGRFDGNNGFAPQSGMNEVGLTFSRLAAPPPEKGVTIDKRKKIITNPTGYLKDILHTCKTIEDVKEYINRYNRDCFSEDVFIYIERSGRYLIVEWDTTIIGNDANYVLSNFCPSVTKPGDALKLNRYRNGMEFLKNGVDTTLSFCTALSDTMHICRPKVGDGTLLTSIWDLNDGIVHLYFYHNYEHVVQFNLKDELAKGDHIIAIPGLFPANAEFEKLATYKTPQNSMPILIFMLFSAGLFLFSAFFFLFSFLRNKATEKYAYLKLALFPLSIIMLYYMYALAMNMYIFYFQAPYKDYKFSLLNIAAYIPVFLLLLIIPLSIANVKVFKENAWKPFSKWLFTLNNVAYLLLMVLFAYWGLFDIFG